MDISPKYISMCRKAEEIQKDWVPTAGDMVAGEWYVNEKDDIGECCFGIISSYEKEKQLIHTIGGGIAWYKDVVWLLPAQDQLQKMSGITPLCNLMHDFHEFMQGLTTPRQYFTNVDGTCLYDLFDTMEQLWLAWLMWNNYQKVWDGKNWVEEEHEK